MWYFYAHFSAIWGFMNFKCIYVKSKNGEKALALFDTYINTSVNICNKNLPQN